MATVQKYDRSMIERYLKKQEWRYLKDNDGDFQVAFARDEDTGREMTFMFITTGSNNQIYQVRVETDLSIPKSEWGRWILLCNEWNESHHWPSAALHTFDNDQKATIILSESLGIGPGIHQELLDDFTDTVVYGANFFWEWIHKEKGL